LNRSTDVRVLLAYQFKTFEHLNQAGRLLVILDGFDEMKHAMTASDFLTNFREFNRLLKGNSKVLLLGRPNALPSDAQQLVFRGLKSVAGQLVASSEYMPWVEWTLDFFRPDESRKLLKGTLALGQCCRLRRQAQRIHRVDASPQPEIHLKQESNVSFKRFTGSDAAMLLVDHQVGTMGWVQSIPFEEMKRNALMLAKTARILSMPVVLTSSMEEYAQGPLLNELSDILPKEFAARIKRMGVVNAMDDTAFAEAVKATGRKRIVLAGVTNDVCTVYPALTLISQGYEVQVVADAGGSPSKMGDDMALRRMEKAGVTLTSTNQLIAELAGNWSSPEGGRIVQEVIMPALQG